MYMPQHWAPHTPPWVRRRGPPCVHVCRAGVTPSPSAAQVRVEHDTRLRPLRQLRARPQHGGSSLVTVHTCSPRPAGRGGQCACAHAHAGAGWAGALCHTCSGTGTATLSVRYPVGRGGGTPLCRPPPSNLAVSARRALDTGGTAGAAQAARIRLLCPRRRRLLADGPHNNKKSVVSSTQGSQLVPLASTNQARPSLTSAFG